MGRWIHIEFRDTQTGTSDVFWQVMRGKWFTLPKWNRRYPRNAKYELFRWWAFPGVQIRRVEFKDKKEV